MRHRNRLPDLVGVLLLCALFVGPAAAADLAALVPQLEPATVALIAYEPRRDAQAERYDIVGGGCFVTTAGHVLTADHVLRRVILPEGHVRRGPDVTRLAVGWLPDAARSDATIITNTSGTRITVVKRNPARDLALIHVQGDEVATVTWADSSVAAGTDVTFLGFPFGSTLGFRPLVNRGTIAGRRQLPGRGKGAPPFRGYILDGSVHPGHSGSPVFDIRTGAAVGLVQRRLAETIPVAIASTEIIAFLRDAGVEPRTTEPTHTTE